MASVPRWTCQLLVWATLHELAYALRTGVAPTYLPTMRQISSYETSNINTKVDSVMEMRTYENEAWTLYTARNRVNSELLTTSNQNTAFRAQNAQLRASLTNWKNLKIYNEDESIREIDRNKKLEPQNVALTVTKTTQDNFIHIRNLTNARHTAHAAKTKARNAALNQEKKTVWLNLEQQERGEWWYHENSIAVEEQNPTEAKSKEYHNEQSTLLNQYVTDLKTRNTMLAATTPGLTADRDTNEAAKLHAQVLKQNMEAEADSNELHVVYLQKSKSALEKLIMQYQMANSDLYAYNAKLTSDVNGLEAERDALRLAYEQMADQRNAAQLSGDHQEAKLNDILTQRDQVKWTLAVDKYTKSGYTQTLATCNTRNTLLKSEKATLEATNRNLQDNCY